MSLNVNVPLERLRPRGMMGAPVEAAPETPRYHTAVMFS